MKSPSPNSETPITVNGTQRSVPEDCSVQALLGILGMEGKRVAVALNRHVVPRSEYNSVRIAGGDRIEILEAVGGG